jgi:SMC interacting uncharacterized protein involved in chromosome segregation
LEQEFSKREDLIGREKALELAERALAMTERTLQDQANKFREKKAALKEDAKKWETAYREMREREREAVSEKNTAVEQINQVYGEGKEKDEMIRELKGKIDELEVRPLVGI